MSSCWLLAADSKTMLPTAGSDYEHKSVQREHLHIMCLHYFSWECVAYLCATSLHGCMCMLVCVWLYDNAGMMSWWLAQDHIQLVAACHPTWLRLCPFMLVEIPGKVPEGSNADTCCGPGGFRCRHLVSFWRVPVQIPFEVPGPGSFTIVQHHCMLVCVWLIVYKAKLSSC